MGKKIVNGISFSKDTPDRVCEILSFYCGNKDQRVRIFYGDKKTGKDWFERWDTIGYIGRSCGQVSVPLIIANKRSLCGPAILDDCIVKITINKQVVYQHPKYHAPIEMRGNALYDTEEGQMLYHNDNGVEKELQFFLGLRNKGQL